MLDVTHIEYTPATSPLLTGADALEGAVAADSVDQYVAGHYGQPAQEHRALAHGQAVVDLSHYGIVTITGSDRLNLLHTLTTQQVQALSAPSNTDALFLGRTGRSAIPANVHDARATAFLTTVPTTNATLLDWMTRTQCA